MPEQKTISKSEAERIFKLEEGHYLDLKRIEAKPAKLSQSVAAFANTSGGELFIGIAEDKLDNGSKVRRWAGFADMEAANGLVQALNGMTALGNHYSATFLKCEGLPGQILHLTVQKTKDILKATDGYPYIRRNAQNFRVISDEDLKRLSLDKGIATFEDETLSVAPTTITNSKRMIEFALQVVPSAEPDEWAATWFQSRQ